MYKVWALMLQIVHFNIRIPKSALTALVDKSGKVASLKRKSSLGSTPSKGTKIYWGIVNLAAVTAQNPELVINVLTKKELDKIGIKSIRADTGL